MKSSCSLGLPFCVINSKGILICIYDINHANLTFYKLHSKKWGEGGKGISPHFPSNGFSINYGLTVLKFIQVT